MFHIDNFFIDFQRILHYFRFGLEKQYFMIDGTQGICFVENATKVYETDLTI